jgi:hypothetical protein
MQFQSIINKNVIHKFDDEVKSSASDREMDDEAMIIE